MTASEPGPVRLRQPQQHQLARVGADYTTAAGLLRRFSYLNFNNFIVAANEAAGTPATLAQSGPPVLLRILNTLHDVGPDALAPQSTFQDNKQIKYDGSFTKGAHTFRFGQSYNHIEEAGFASFFGNAPRVRASYTAATRAFANATAARVTRSTSAQPDRAGQRAGLRQRTARWASPSAASSNHRCRHLLPDPGGGGRT